MEIFNYLRSVPEPITDIPRLQEVSVNLVMFGLVNYLSKLGIGEQGLGGGGGSGGCIG